MAALIPAAALAQGAALPTTEEAAEGWIALFDGETLFGWNEIGGGNWEVVDGVLTCSGGHGGGALMTTSVFGDFELIAKMRPGKETTAGLELRGSADGHPTDTGGVAVTLVGPKQDDIPWSEVRVVAQGSTISVAINGDKPVEMEAKAAQGRIGIQWHNRRKVEVASIKLRPIAMAPLFNGKDLSGWNIIPGRDSEFSVIDGLADPLFDPRRELLHALMNADLNDDGVINGVDLGIFATSFGLILD